MKRIQAIRELNAFRKSARRVEVFSDHSRLTSSILPLAFCSSGHIPQSIIEFGSFHSKQKKPPLRVGFHFGLGDAVSAVKGGVKPGQRGGVKVDQ